MDGEREAREHLGDWLAGPGGIVTFLLGSVFVIYMLVMLVRSLLG